MNSVKQGLFGILTAALLSVIVLGSLVLALVESTPVAAGLADPGVYLGSPVLPTLGPFMVGQIPTLSLNMAANVGEISAAIGDFSGSAPTCLAPAGWALYIVMPDDTATSLAQRFGVSLAEFSQRNCFEIAVNTLPPGSTVYVPLASIPFAAVVALQPVEPSPAAAVPGEPAQERKERCGPPSWWSAYTVRWGDTLSSLAVASGSSIVEIRQANCLRSDSGLRAGQTLFLPIALANPAVSAPARRPVPTAVPPTPMPTVYPTLPGGPPQPTAPSPTEIPVGTPLPTVEPTEVPAPTMEPTEEPAPTVEPTQVPLPTVEPTQEPAPTVEPTQLPPPTVEPTQKPAPTVEPTEAPALTVEPTQKPAPTSEPTQEPVPALEPTGEASRALLDTPDLYDSLGVAWPGRWFNSLPYIVVFYPYRDWIG